MTTDNFSRFKNSDSPFTALTAYDASMARLLEQAGIDMILVGDSLGNVVQGEESTLGVTVDDMTYHAGMVARGAPNTLRMVDMPFASFASQQDALHTAKQLVQRGKAQMLKCEVGRVQQLDIVEHLVNNGIPMCVHLGLLPQSVLALGYQMQGKDASSIDRLDKLAHLAQIKGAAMLLFECIEPTATARLMQNISIPVLGIGSGPATDGQILVIHDLLGISPDSPPFAKDFLQQSDSIQGAIRAYIGAVKQREFPQA